MRPPSYYSSLASGNSEIGSKYGGNSNLSRSSFSSPTSSTYATRSHLPYVPTSMLVAHCISGASSGHSARAKPSYQATSGYSTSYSRPNSQKRYQPSTATTTPTRPSSSTSYLSPYSSSNSYHSTRLPSSSGSGSSYTPSTSYTTTRSSYLTAPGSTRTSYRPSALSTVYNYKPIRLRDRPLLTQISRQIDTKTTTPRSSRLEASSDTKASEENWDVGRNISRNKYLIKFREFDKRKDSSAELTKRVVTPDEPPIEPKVEPERESVQQEKVVVLEVEPEEKVKVESVGEEVDLGEVLESVEAEPVMKIESTVTTSELPAELPKPDEPLRPKAAPDICDADASKSVESRQPRARRNMKLKIKTRSNAPESDENADLATTKTKAKRTPPESPVVLVKPAAREKAKDKTLKKVCSSKKVKATTAVEAEPQRKALKEVQPVVAANQDAKDVVTETAEQPKDPNAPKPPVTQPPTTVNKRIRCREYNLDDFDFISVLGHGGWGFVILAELKGHDACFAVKCIKKITIVEDDDFDSIMIERYLFFAMEYCAGGDLMFHVQKEGKFTEARCRFYAAEIICAIRFLHNRHIIYRDLKLDNILLDATGHVRLVDFGMCQCRTYREDMLPSNFCGTPEYISPEIIKGVPYNHSVDWWSFGVLLYEMAVGKMPFRGNDENELLWNVCYEQIHYPMFLSKELTSLLQLLLEREPTKRMGMATCKAGDIYDQPWFRGVDWTAVESLRVKPPFVPEVNSNRDVQNFDADFTESRAELSPVDEATLQRIDQSQFQRFPYTNPNIDIFDPI